MEKVNLETARKEVMKWLDFKKVDREKIEDSEDNIVALAKGICSGYLVLDKDCNFIQKLKFPILDDDGNPFTTELKMKPRLRMGEIEDKSQNLPAGNTFALIRAYVSALTNINSEIIKKMDSEDQKIAQSVVIFFL